MEGDKEDLVNETEEEAKLRIALQAFITENKEFKD